MSLIQQGITYDTKTSDQLSFTLKANHNDTEIKEKKTFLGWPEQSQLSSPVSISYSLADDSFYKNISFMRLVEGSMAELT